MADEAKVRLEVDGAGAQQSAEKLAAALERAGRAQDKLNRDLREANRLTTDRRRMLASMTDRGLFAGGSGGGIGRSSVGHTPGGGFGGAVDAVGARFGLSSRAMTAGGGALAAFGVVRQGALSFAGTSASRAPRVRTRATSQLRASSSTWLQYVFQRR